MIAKKPEIANAYRRRVVPFRSARAAFRAILQALRIEQGRVLLPAYIGWSPREGSGVFDPIASLGLGYGFYNLDLHLRIDLDALRAELNRGDVRVLVIIHYFGYVDPCYEEAVRIARNHGVFVVEDEAHAMLSDVSGGICGRLGDACIYSLHKLLPVPSGGAALINDAASPVAQALAADPDCEMPLWGFDLKMIGDKRRANALVLHEMMRDLAPCAEPLFGPPRFGEFPQTYPVIIRNGSRDRLYQEMNAAGFGVVSLYHTLISQISTDRFSAPARLSRHILNLPVHQDASEEELAAMVRELARGLRTT